jgi:hypothetical protein
VKSLAREVFPYFTGLLHRATSLGSISAFDRVISAFYFLLSVLPWIAFSMSAFQLFRF